MAKKVLKPIKKISSSSRLEDLLEETEEELAALEPQIEKLEKQLNKLKELKLAKQKLITLKLSIKSILNNYSDTKVSLDDLDLNSIHFSSTFSKKSPSKNFNASLTTSMTSFPLGQTFLPETAFSEANQVLRKKTSINYELFRAVVFNGGKASTEQIKQYLIEHNIKQPANGEGFEQVELTDISSRINYLVRKGLVSPDGRGQFVSNLGWAQVVG